MIITTICVELFINLYRKLQIVYFRINYLDNSLPFLAWWQRHKNPPGEDWIQPVYMFGSSRLSRFIVICLVTMATFNTVKIPQPRNLEEKENRPRLDIWRTSVLNYYRRDDYFKKFPN